MLQYHMYVIPEKCKLKNAVALSYGCSLDYQEGLASGSPAVEDNFLDKKVRRDAQMVESKSD